MPGAGDILRAARIGERLRAIRDKGQELKERHQEKIDAAQLAAYQAGTYAAQTTRNVAQQGKATAAAGIGMAGAGYAAVKASSFGFIIFLSLFVHYVRSEE